MNLSGQQCHTIHLNPKTKSNFLDDGQKIQKTTLPNNIKIITHKIPYIRSLTMGIWINAGSRDEEKHEHGIAHFLEHMLFKGTHKRSAYDIAKEFDAIGGNSNAFTSVEATCYFAQVMDEHFEDMAEILADIFMNSKFDCDEIENEKPVIIQEIEMFEESNEDYVMSALDKKRWQNHSLGRSVLGNPCTVKNLSVEDLKNFYSKHYCAENIIIALAGNIEHERAIDVLGNTFGTLDNQKCRKNKRIIPKSFSGLAFEKKSAEQYHLCLGTEGYSKKDSNRFKASLFTTILGGNMSSRLFQEIREKRGLAYTIYSFFNQFADTGMLGVYAAVSKENLIPAIELIVKELIKIREKKNSAGEIESAKAFTKGNLLLSMESSENLMVKLAQNEILYNRYIPFEETIEKIEKITWNDIRLMADRILNEDNITASIVGPREFGMEKINKILKFS